MREPTSSSTDTPNVGRRILLVGAELPPTRILQASRRVSVRPHGDPVWADTHLGVASLRTPHSPVSLGLSFANLRDPLAAGETAHTVHQPTVPVGGAAAEFRRDRSRITLPKSVDHFYVVPVQEE